MSEIEPTSSPKASLKFEFKKSTVKQRKAKTDVRVFTLGKFKERERKGCYLHVDLKGTDFPIWKQVTVVGSRLDTRVIPAGSGRKSTLETGILTSLTLTDII